jgi:hypothetical protein
MAIHMGINPKNLRSPKDPFTRIEPAYDCDGSECNRGIHDDDGTLIDLPPHFHMIETDPDGGYRCYAIDGNLPEEVFEPSHLD